MDEEGDVSVQSSAFIDVEEELGNLRNSITALTQMMQMVLQRLDGMVFAQFATSGQSCCLHGVLLIKWCAGNVRSRARKEYPSLTNSG